MDAINKKIAVVVLFIGVALSVLMLTTNYKAYRADLVYIFICLMGICFLLLLLPINPTV